MKEDKTGKIGRISTIDGPIIGVLGLKKQKIGDIVRIGNKRMIGEVIKIIGDKTITQCYDFTDGLGVFEPVFNEGNPISMELGPGLLTSVFDGIQRSLIELNKSSSYLEPGLEISSISKVKKWFFEPIRKCGENLLPGDVIGFVKESARINHKIMVPFGVQGTLSKISEKGDYTIEQEIYEISNDGEKKSFSMIQKWPIRSVRPIKKRLYPQEPLITGIRVLDLIYPIAKGGSAAIPGGFGTGKTVIQHNIAKWSDADIIVYVHCGERGIELTDILDEFEHLVDPKTGFPLLERTVFIGHTSNMPFSSRETSIFSGLTIAEYYRDMGYHVALLVDSLSRWVESLRELSARLEEMPAAGGFPAYMSTRLANFYERAGFTTSLGTPERNGSITLVGTVSPPAGDFSEPVTKSVKRFVRCFWALDSKMAFSRMFPAVNWNESYSLYGDYLENWWDENIEPGWGEARKAVSEILSQNEQLENIILLVGEDNLPRNQQLVRFNAKMIKNAFILQDSFNLTDRYSTPEKTLKFIKLILSFYERSLELVDANIPLSRIQNLPIFSKIMKIGNSNKNKDIAEFEQFQNELEDQFNQLIRDYNLIK